MAQVCHTIKEAYSVFCDFYGYDETPERTPHELDDYIKSKGVGQYEDLNDQFWQEMVSEDWHHRQHSTSPAPGQRDNAAGDDGWEPELDLEHRFELHHSQRSPMYG